MTTSICGYEASPYTCMCSERFSDCMSVLKIVGRKCQLQLNLVWKSIVRNLECP